MARPSDEGVPYRTKQELVYRRLRDDIMRCQLAPGQRLVIDELARRLSMTVSALGLTLATPLRWGDVDFFGRGAAGPRPITGAKRFRR